MPTIERLKCGATIGLVLVSLIINQLPVDGQTRRGRVRQETARPTAPALPNENVSPSPDPESKKVGTVTGERVPLMQSPRALAMAEAFDSGKLPEPSRLPPGNIDQQAVVLAKTISAGDDSSTGALYAAILATGYGVRDGEGGILQTTERGQGLAFDAWEVAAISKLYGQGYGVALSHLAEAFTRYIPELKGLPLADILLEGIRAGARSEHPAVRFWARLIVELGRQSAVPYDLLAQVNAARVRLDALQVFLILSRLAGDFAVLEGQRRAAHRKTESIDYVLADYDPQPAGPNRATFYRKASYNLESERLSYIRVGMKNRSPSLASAQFPCSQDPTDLQGLISDANALTRTTAFGHIAEGAPGRLGAYGKGAGVANIVLTVLKFVLTYAMLKTEIAINDRRLTRTKNTRPGELKVFIARVWIDNKAQGVNCLRRYLNYAGIDFDLPNSGPVTGVKVVAAGAVGFDEESRDWRDDLLDKFKKMGYEGVVPGDKIVFLIAREQYTNNSGLALISVAGKPQARDLSREKLTEVTKLAGVRVWVQFKPTRIKDAAGAASTVVDIMGPLTSFLTGDISGGIAGAATEVLYRLSWYPSEPSYFFVKDWEPCEGHWFGTITSSTRVEDNSTRYGETSEVVIKDQSTYNFEANITLKGARASATMQAEEFRYADNKSGYGRITLERKASAEYSGEVEVSVDVSPSGTYGVGFERPRMIGAFQTTYSCERPAPYKCRPPTSVSSGRWEADGRYMPIFKGKMDPNKPNEIDETRSWNDGLLEHKFTVKLKRCL